MSDSNICDIFVTQKHMQYVIETDGSREMSFFVYRVTNMIVSQINDQIQQLSKAG